MEPLKIGNIILPHRAVFGPMAGFTDAPCRRLMAQHGAGFTVSEMVSSRALVYGDHKTVSLLKAEPNGAPYGVQIFGEVPEIMGEATAAIEQYEFDFVDINMGCPAPKIVSGGAGSKLMLDPDRCGRIVEQVVANTKRPVTVKMRKGWDADHITAVECAKACEQAGAALIAVHARTREKIIQQLHRLCRRHRLIVNITADEQCLRLFLVYAPQNFQKQLPLLLQHGKFIYPLA